MSKIRQAFKNKKKCFIPFITGGDPNLEVSKELILAMAAAGADIIEIGIPFCCRRRSYSAGQCQSVKCRYYYG